LGNSCYLNSTLQCLSHIPALTSYFLSTRSTPHLNTASRDGTGGQLVKEFTNVVSELWFGHNRVVEPRALKSQLGKIRPEYNGFEQHDAHEVVEVIIDKVFFSFVLFTVADGRIRSYMKTLTWLGKSLTWKGPKETELATLC
jgi:ubiquitin C-terminal hydrolase